ncbi:peptidase inhibitor family I36 protein [Pseudophaeobacter sp.]|uniref:peptidase inhibitor family I36 protein n=1 Tax=Pseudophaeobacter sp. TaxID=1971739 RepID=UPI003454A9AC
MCRADRRNRLSGGHGACPQPAQARAPTLCPDATVCLWSGAGFSGAAGTNFTAAV